MLTPFFPGTHNCVDNAEVVDVDLDSQEEDLKVKRKGRMKKLMKTRYLKMTLFSLMKKKI